MFLYCKEPFIQLRKLLNFEVENPTGFLRLKPLVNKIRIGVVATLTKKNQHRELYFETKYISLHVLTFSACAVMYIRRERTTEQEAI